MLLDHSLGLVDTWIGNFDAWVSGRDFIHRRAKSALGAATLGLCQAARRGNVQKDWAASWRISVQDVSNEQWLLNPVG